MKIHLMRVEVSKGRRAWWIKGDTASMNDLMKYPPWFSRWTCIRRFEKFHGCTVDELVKYKGISSPAEAAMTAAGIIRKHEKGGEDE